MTMRQVIVPFTVALIGKIQEVAAVGLAVDKEIEAMFAETEGLAMEHLDLVTNIDPIFTLTETEDVD